MVQAAKPRKLIHRQSAPKNNICFSFSKSRTSSAIVQAIARVDTADSDSECVFHVFNIFWLEAKYVCVPPESQFSPLAVT